MVDAETTNIVMLTMSAVLMIPVMIRQRIEFLQANGYRREKRLLFFLGWIIQGLILLRLYDAMAQLVDIPYLRGVLILSMTFCLYQLYHPPHKKDIS